MSTNKAVRKVRQSTSSGRPTTSARLAVIEERTERILEQTTKTNGRVNQHDTWIAQHTAESNSNTEALKELRTTVEDHTALVHKAAGAWWVLGAVATIAGAIVGAAAEHFLLK